jgi:IS5 family transposase
MTLADAVLADEEIVIAVYEALAKRHSKSRCRGRRGTLAEMVLSLLALTHVLIELELRRAGARGTGPI